ncbi:MAG TPA: hypothetical protein VK935_15060 [Actinomycetospora sp.]|nr:hypothetical protein [Actinomycetospora sp.]
MSVVATLVFVLLVAAWWVAAWWIAAARSERFADRTPAGDAPRAVFGRGVLTAGGRWRPVGLPGAEPDPGVAEAGDGPAAIESGRLTAPRPGVFL